MNNLRNSITLIGNLGKDPEYKELENGNSVARMSVATDEVYKNNKGEKITTTQWHNCIAWGKTAEIAHNLLKRGNEVALRGKLTYRSYETEAGEKRYVTEIVVNELMVLN